MRYVHLLAIATATVLVGAAIQNRFGTWPAATAGAVRQDLGALPIASEIDSVSGIPGLSASPEARLRYLSSYVDLTRLTSTQRKLLAAEVIQTLRRSRAESDKVAAASLLGRLRPDPGAREYLLRMTTNSKLSITLQAEAVVQWSWHLQQRRDARDVNRMNALLSSSEPDIVVAAARGCGYSGMQECVPLLRRLRRAHPEKRVRVEVQSELEWLSKKRAEPGGVERTLLRDRR
jgi:hypothetical protein